MKPLLASIFFALALSVSGQSLIDTSHVGEGGIQRLADSVATSMTSAQNQETQTRTRKIKIIKKDVPYSAYIKLAIGMMAFIALFYTTSQNYNPSE
jgi:hypothetical protein